MTTPLLAAAVVLLGSAAVHVALRADAPPLRLLGAPPWVRRRLADAALPVPPDAAWTAALGGVGTTTVVALAAGGPALALVAATATVGGPALVLAARRGRAAAEVDAALPDVLDAVARSLRSGAVLHRALQEVEAAGRLGDDLRHVDAATAAGRPLVAAVDDWVDRCPTPGVRLAASALALSAEAGGAGARAVDGVAATLRANLAVAGEIRAQSSQARLSGLVIALAPLAFALLAAATDGRTASFLLRTPFGLACLAAGLALDAVAAWWMHLITADPR